MNEFLRTENEHCIDEIMLCSDEARLWEEASFEGEDEERKN